MNTVLLTWNPGPSDEHIFSNDEWLDEMVLPSQNGELVDGTWSVANHVNNIEPGDAAFMYRQGEFGRGIVARGVIRSYPWEGKHWDTVNKPNETTNYVNVEWHEAVPVEVAIDVDALEMLIPDFKWRHVYSSGRVVPERQGARLSVAWSRYVVNDCIQARTALYSSDEWRNLLAVEATASD